jgi:hypothetical protein
LKAFIRREDIRDYSYTKNYARIILFKLATDSDVLWPQPKPCVLAITVPSPAASFQLIEFSPLDIIADKKASDSDLLYALLRLGPVDEKASYWSSLANDTVYREGQRLLCIIQLFKRHVPIGTRLNAVGAILDNPTWASPRQINKMDAIFGSVPLKSFDGSIFSIAVFPKRQASHDFGTIYLRFSGDITKQDFINILQGKHANEKAGQAVLLEIGFS